MRHRRQGVPAGYRENWKYTGRWSEQKKRDRWGRTYWPFVFKATKRRKAKGYGGFGRGTKGAWKVKGVQYITKTGKGEYQTVLIGKKYPMRFYVKRTRRR